jgi:hypothetical protein
MATTIPNIRPLRQQVPTWNHGRSTIQGYYSRYSRGTHLLIKKKLESDHVSPYTPSDWSHLPEAYDNADTIAYQAQLLGSGLSTNHPHSSYTSPDTDPYLNRSPSISSSSPLPVVLASNASAPLHLSMSQYSSNNVTRCRQCARDFTGKYGVGNCARHVRLKHAGADNALYKCNASDCHKIYQRQDARLKHERRKHPELHLSPAMTRRGTEHQPTISSAHKNSAVAQDLNYDVGRWLTTDQAPVGSHTYRDQELFLCTDRIPYAAHSTITALQAELSPSDYLRAFDAFFVRWQCIVQQLLQKKYVVQLTGIVVKLTCGRSEAYPAYAQVLDDIRSAVHAIDVAARDTCVESGGNRSRVSQKDRAAPRGNRNLGLGSSTLPTSSASRVSKRCGHRSSLADDTSKDVLVALDELSNQGSQNEVDCPVYKHHFMHRTSPPCRGCRVRVMSQVRSHLNPCRAGTHRGFPTFVMQCYRCKQDFVEREAYNDHTNSNSCAFQSQQRGDIIIPWGRQYLALYPNASRIPLPWPGERGWLPDWVLAQCRVPRAVLTVSSHSLEGSQSRSELHSSAQSAMVAQIYDLGQTAAMGHMLTDLVSPEYVQSTPSSIPENSTSRQITARLQPPSNGSVADNGQYWQSTLNSLERHQSVIRRAAPHLSQEQLHFMVTQSERILAISQGLYEQYSVIPTQIQVHPPGEIGFALRDNSIVVLSTPAQFQSPHNMGYDHFVESDTGSLCEIQTPSTGTIPNTPSHGYWSPQDPGSTFTNPSSNYAPNDPNFLSPYSPLQYRGTSLPSENNEDVTRSRQNYASRMSPQDDCIDPAVLSSYGGTSDDDIVYHEYMHRYPDDNF